MHPMTPSLSLHDQVRLDLMERIRSGEFAPDTPIPSEAQLCDDYTVSRVTIRRAIGDLCANNVLYRRHGVGTFVTNTIASAQSMQLRGSLAEALAEDPRMHFKVTGKAQHVDDPGMAPHFGRSVPVVRIEFLVIVNSTVMALAHALFPSDGSLFPDTTVFDGTKQPVVKISEMLRRDLGRAEQTLFAVNADHLSAEKLGVPIGSSIMQMERTYYDIHDEPLAHVTAYLHPQHVKINVSLQYTSADGGRLTSRTIKRRPRELG